MCAFFLISSFGGQIWIGGGWIGGFIVHKCSTQFIFLTQEREEKRKKIAGTLTPWYPHSPAQPAVSDAREPSPAGSMSRAPRSETPSSWKIARSRENQKFRQELRHRSTTAINKARPGYKWQFIFEVALLLTSTLLNYLIFTSSMGEYVVFIRV